MTPEVRMALITDVISVHRAIRLSGVDAAELLGEMAKGSVKRRLMEAPAEGLANDIFAGCATLLRRLGRKGSSIACQRRPQRNRKIRCGHLMCYLIIAYIKYIFILTFYIDS